MVYIVDNGTQNALLGRVGEVADRITDIQLKLQRAVRAIHKQAARGVANERGISRKFSLTFRHRESYIQDRRFAALQRTLFVYLINKYISLSDICLTVHHLYKKYRQPTRCNNNGLLIIPVSSTCYGQLFSRWPATSWVHYTTDCNTQSSAPEDG